MNPEKATAQAKSVNPDEIAHFSAMAETWWDPKGPFKPLHQLNPTRVAFVRDQICRHFGRDPLAEKPLKGLRILDIGCGGGLLSEPVARLGADVVGADASEKNIKTASVHAEQMSLDIDYRHITAEELVDAGEKFDVILNMEVIEHVTTPKDFIRDCAKMVRPGGLMICSTINRSFKAFAFAIVGAEYVLRWLPRGTHQYAKLVKPLELRRYLIDAGLSPEPSIGMTLNPFTNDWQFSDDTGINYVTVGKKDNIKI